MRDQMSSFDIARMVRDIGALAGARCRKMYQPHYEQVVFRLNPKGIAKCDLVIVRGDYRSHDFTKPVRDAYAARRNERDDQGILE